MLFFDGIRYLQYPEGPDDGLQIGYCYIGASSLQSDVMELARCRLAAATIVLPWLISRTIAYLRRAAQRLLSTTRISLIGISL